MANTDNLPDYVESNEINAPEFSQSGENERRAIASADQGLSIARNLERSDETRDLRRARIQSAYNGSAPYRQTELEAKGQSWRFNLSFRFLRGLVARSMAPFHELGADESYLSNIQGQISEVKLNIIREEFVNTVKDWGKWFRIYERLTLDLALFGHDCAIFPSDDNPFPVVVEQAHALVPERSENDVDSLDVFCMKKYYRIHELYDFIKHPESAEAAGWNLKNTRDALENAMPSRRLGDTAAGGWLETEKAIREGSLYWSYGNAASKEIKVFHVLVPEIYGDEVWVDQWVVLDTLSKRKTDRGGTKLFHRKKMFKKLSDCLVYFYFEAGDGTWHGSMGVGWAGFNTHASIDRLRNNILDQAFMSSQIIAQAQSEITEEEQNMQVVGGMVIVPPSMTVLKERFPQMGAELFTLDALLTSTIEQSTGDMVPNESSAYRPGEQKTATQSSIDASRNQILTRVDMRRFIDPFGKMVSIMLRRLLMKNSSNPFSQALQKKLLDKGITQEEMDAVSGSKSFGDIDDILRLTEQNSGIAMAEFKGDPDVHQRALKKKRLTVLLSQKIADELMPDMVDPLDNLEQARQQMEEITTINAGMGVPVSPRDLHEVHAAVIISDVSAKLQAAKMGQGKPISPEQLMQELNHGMEHVQMLLKDSMKKDMGKKLDEQIKNIAGMVQQQIKQTAALIGQVQDAKSAAAQMMAAPPSEPALAA